MDIENLPPGILELLKHSGEQTEALERAIGKFSIDFLSMEEELDRTIHELLSLDPDTGFALTSAILNISTRFDILERLASELPIAAEDRAVILAAIAEARKLNAYRNWLLHTPWAGSSYLGRMGEALGEFTHTKRRMEARGKAKWATNSFKTSEITKHGEQCSSVIRKVRPVVASLVQARLAKENGNKVKQKKA